VLHAAKCSGQSEGQYPKRVEQCGAMVQAPQALVVTVLLSVVLRVAAECQTCTLDNAHSGHWCVVECLLLLTGWGLSVRRGA
jgi:hypothetical protein